MKKYVPTIFIIKNIVVIKQCKVQLIEMGFRGAALTTDAAFTSLRRVFSVVT